MKAIFSAHNALLRTEVTKYGLGMNMERSKCLRVTGNKYVCGEHGMQINECFITFDQL